MPILDDEEIDALYQKYQDSGGEFGILVPLLVLELYSKLLTVVNQQSTEPTLAEF